MQVQRLARASLRKGVRPISVSQSLQFSQGRHTLLRSYSSHYSKDATTIVENNPFLNISKEVKEAIADNRPVVALESAIYTHGFSIIVIFLFLV